jgi:hypothetical protein
MFIQGCRLCQPAPLLLRPEFEYTDYVLGLQDLHLRLYILYRPDPSTVDLALGDTMRIISFIALSLSSLSLLCTGLVGVGGVYSRLPQLYLLKVRTTGQDVIC